MDTVTIDGIAFQAHCIALQHGSLLLIQGQQGMLGCGYFNIETAEKLHDALAIVSGVKNYDDMLAATVKTVSGAAAALGVTPGMSGREALLRMR